MNKISWYRQNFGDNIGFHPTSTSIRKKYSFGLSWKCQYYWQVSTLSDVVDRNDGFCMDVCGNVEEVSVVDAN